MTGTIIFGQDYQKEDFGRRFGAYKDKESYSYIKKNRMGHSARVDDPCRRYQSTGHIFFPGSKGLCLVGNHLSGILF